MRKSGFIIIMTGIIVCSMLTSCGRLSKTEVNRKAPIAQEVDDTYFSSAVVSRGNVTAYENFRLNYKSGETASLKFSANNVTITKTYFALGDSVKQGDLIAECSSNTLENKVLKLEAEVSEYQAQLDFYTEMTALEAERKLVYISYGRDYSSEAFDEYNEELENCQKKLNISMLELEEAKEELEGCRIYAPMDGVITYIAKTSDRHRLRSSDAAVKIGNEQEFLQCTTDKPEFFEVGGTYTLEYYSTGKDNKTSNYQRGYIEGFNQQENTETEIVKKSVPVKCISIDVVNNSETVRNIRFLPEEEMEIEEGATMIYEINIVTDSSENALFVPVLAVISSGDESVVYVQDGDGQRSIKKVITGVEAKEVTEIKEGLTLGETVLMRNNK